MGNLQPVARRPRKANLRGYVNLLKVILIAVFVVYALYYFSQSSFFFLREIEVHGQKHLASAEIGRESGLSAGMNIFQINLDQAKKRLLTNPWIESVDLRRQLPHTVQIIVKERQPSALLYDIAGQHWLVLDRNGICIEGVGSLHMYSLPIITGIKPDASDPGKQVSANPLLQPVLAALDPSVENFFSEIDISNGDNLIAYTRDVVPVLLGKCQDLHSKLAVAQSLMANLNNSGTVMYVDIRSAQAPAVKYLEAASH